MKIAILILATISALALGGCAAFSISTPYGSASSDGKTAKVVTAYGSGSADIRGFAK